MKSQEERIQWWIKIAVLLVKWLKETLKGQWQEQVNKELRLCAWIWPEREWVKERARGRILGDRIGLLGRLHIWMISWMESRISARRSTTWTPLRAFRHRPWTKTRNNQMRRSPKPRNLNPKFHSLSKIQRSRQQMSNYSKIQNNCSNVLSKPSARILKSHQQRRNLLGKRRIRTRSRHWSSRIKRPKSRKK